MSTDPQLEAIIDETLEQTFPASDAPSWTLGRYRPPQQPAAACPSTAPHGIEQTLDRTEQTDSDDRMREQP